MAPSPSSINLGLIELNGSSPTVKTSFHCGSIHALQFLKRRERRQTLLSHRPPVTRILGIVNYSSSHKATKVKVPGTGTQQSTTSPHVANSATPCSSLNRERKQKGGDLVALETRTPPLRRLRPDTGTSCAGEEQCSGSVQTYKLREFHDAALLNSEHEVQSSDGSAPTDLLSVGNVGDSRESKRKTMDVVLSRVLKNTARLRDVRVMMSAMAPPIATSSSADEEESSARVSSSLALPVAREEEGAGGGGAVARGDQGTESSRGTLADLEAWPISDRPAFSPDFGEGKQAGAADDVSHIIAGSNEEEGVWVLNRILAEAGTVVALLDILAERKGDMTPLNLCTAFHRVAKWTCVVGEGSSTAVIVVEDERVRWLSREVERHLSSYSPHALANIAWAHSRLGHGSPDLMGKIAEAAILKASVFQPFESVILMHAFAKAGVANRALFHALMQPFMAASPNLDIFTARDLKDIAWSHARLGLSSPDLFRAIAAAAIPKIGEFTGQSLATIAWAYAKVGFPAEELFQAVATSAVLQTEPFTPQDISNLAWAYAKAGVHSTVLMDVLAERALAMLPRFGAQSLSNTTWAFGTLRHRHEALFDAAAEEIMCKLPSFSPQALSNTAWAYAVLGHSCPRLLEGIEDAAVPLLPQMTDQSLHTLAFAFAMLGHPAPAFFNAVSAEVLGRLRREGSGGPRQSLVMLAWAMVVLGHICPSLFPEMRTQISQCCDYSSHELCQLYQVELALQLEAPAIGEARLGLHGKSATTYFNDLWLSGYTKQQAKICWQRANEIERRQVSDFQGQVARTLRSMGLHIIEEYHDGDYSIDVAVLPHLPSPSPSPFPPKCSSSPLVPTPPQRTPGQESHGLRVAVEADGPSHFAYNGARLPLGPTNLKARLLRRLGWHVIQIAYYDWKDLRSEAERTRYLSRALGTKLEEALKASSTVERGRPLLEGRSSAEQEKKTEGENGGADGDEEEGEREKGAGGATKPIGGQGGRKDVLLRARRLQMMGLMLPNKGGKKTTKKNGLLGRGAREALMQEGENWKRSNGEVGVEDHLG